MALFTGAGKRSVYTPGRDLIMKNSTITQRKEQVKFRKIFCRHPDVYPEYPPRGKHLKDFAAHCPGAVFFVL
jgi:hypothetical protein